MPVPHVPLFLCLLVLAPPVAAQTSCLRGRPLPTCTNWWITEPFLGSVHSGGTFAGQPHRRSDAVFGIELGAMINATPRHAAGASFVWSTRTVGARARYRLWLTPELGLDLGPGFQANEDGIVAVELVGGIMVHDVAGMYVGAARNHDRDRWEMMFGMRGGGVPGLVLSVLGFAYAVYVSNALGRL